MYGSDVIATQTVKQRLSVNPEGRPGENGSPDSGDSTPLEGLISSYSGRFGYAPGMFLKPYKNPHQNLQVSFNHERFGSTPNLLKAVNSRILDKDLSLELPSGVLEKTTLKPQLEKRKSRSLINLQDSDKIDADFSILSTRMDTAVEWCKQDSGTSGSPQTAHSPSFSLFQENHESCSEWTIDKTEPNEERERKDSGFDEQHSPQISIDLNDGDTPPPIPQRPSLQEIHSKCTTITRRAALQANI